MQNQEIAVSSGVYVDVENLGDSGQQVVKSLLDSWPGTAPQPSLLALYVRADQAELWRIWSSRAFPDMRVRVKGVQHFVPKSSKNSADMAIAIDAIRDLLSREISFVVVVSDDSDFVSLFTAVREETLSEAQDGQIPFLWVTTNRDATLSPAIRQYFPPEYLHTVAIEAASRPASTPKVAKSREGATGQRDGFSEIVDVLVEGISVGGFKSTDCQKLIKKQWPQHAMANMNGPTFGSEFVKVLWPLLEARGVRLAKKKPRKYEMTEEAKGA